MANALHRFLKKSHVLGFINTTKLASPFLSHTSLSENAIPAASILGNRFTQVVNPDQDAAEELQEDGESDDVEERVIRADSVKKKRKKKMNKHKYKKLRKRLRRKT